MPFWKSTNFTIPPPQSSFAPTKLRRSLPDLSFFRPRRASRSSRARPRLTRQRKLRHLTDLDIPSLDADPSRPSASSSDSSTTPSSSPTNRDQPSTTHSSSVRPLPLPLPDLPASLKREESAATTNSSSNLMNSGCCPLPSPRDVSRRRGDSKDLTAGDGNGESVLSTSTVGRPSLDQGKKELGDSIQHIQNDFGLKVPPARSSQTSGFSSPALSPQRMSTGDIYASPVYYQGLQVWSAPEFPADMTFGQTSPDKFFSVPNSKNLNGTASPLHSKMPLENAASRPETNGTVAFHPLPLPPGAALPSSPAFVHQIVQKSEVSSMKSKWQKGKLIGSGTFGNVYVATNRETGALCAMKEVNLIPDDPKSDESTMQLAQEIKVLSKLKHQNIVQYYGSEIVEDRFYIYLEYVHPGSISKYIRDHCGSMTESVVRNFTRHILSGLAYLHSKKTIHRDIKGANLLVDSSGVVKLADFGMAKHLSGRAAALSLRGSPYWMAPEVMQAMMQKDAGYDLAVDIWSLGCTIIEMFTGKPPWSEFEGAAAMFKVLRNESPPVPETLSAEGKNFLQCCFKRNPAERPSAIVLLEHPFVKNSHHPELNGTIRAISGMKLTDTTQSPRERGSSMQISTQDSNSKQSSNSETGQSYPETSKSTAVSHHSPRSTLEAIRSLSPPHSNESARDSSPSDIPNGINPGARNSRLHPLSRHHRGREVPYLSRD